MFKKTNVPILGIVENMSYIEEDNGKKKYIFGKDGAEKLSKKTNIPLIQKIEIDETFNNFSNNNNVFNQLSENIKIKFINIINYINNKIFY